MKDLVVVALGVVLALLIILVIKKFPGSEEGWYPTTTYVNTPSNMGVYPTSPTGNWGGNYYQRLNWFPWGYHRPNWYNRYGTAYGGINQHYINYSAPEYVSPVFAMLAFPGSSG